MFGRKYNLRPTGYVYGNGRSVFRLVAARDFENSRCGMVREGTQGGVVASNKNLSHEGGAWVGYDGVVLDDSRIEGDAYVKGQVTGQSKVTGCAYIDGRADVADSYIGGDTIIGDGTFVHVLCCLIEGNRATVRQGATIKECLVAGNVVISNEANVRLRKITGVGAYPNIDTAASWERRAVHDRAMKSCRFETIVKVEFYRMLTAKIGPLPEETIRAYDESAMYHRLPPSGHCSLDLK